MFLSFSTGENIHKSIQHCAVSIMRKSIYILLLCFIILNSNSFAASPKAPLVVVAKAKSESVIKQISLTGTVTSPRISRLSTEISGLVKSIKVDIGDAIKQGDVLLQLDQEIEELSLKASQAATLQVREELAEAKRRFQSAKRLRKQSGISQEELDQREADVKIAKAALQKQLAEEQKQRALLTHHSVKAPFSGVINKKLTEVGEWVNTGNPVLNLIATDNLYIDFQVPQEIFSDIKINNAMTISFSALPGKNWRGNVTTIVPVSDPESRTFLIRSQLNNSDIQITPGMSAQGVLHLATDKQSVVISRDAIIRYSDGRVTVWVINVEANKSIVSERHVKPGHSFNGKVVVHQGLNSGDTVVIQGNESLKQGQQVRIHRSE